MKSLLSILFFIGTAPLFSQVDLGAEATYSFTNSNVDVPGYLADNHKNLSSGNGSDFSLGLILDFKSASTIRMGFRTWRVPFKHTYVRDNNRSYVEEGKFRTNGLYFRYEPSWDYIFISVGFDIGVSHLYKNDLTVLNGNGEKVRSESNRRKSVLPNGFDPPVNMVFSLGPLIPINESFKIKGIVGFIFPMKVLYDPMVSYQQVYLSSGKQAPDAEPTINYLVNFKFGVGLDYYF